MSYKLPFINYISEKSHIYKCIYITRLIVIITQLVRTDWQIKVFSKELVIWLADKKYHGILTNDVMNRSEWSKQTKNLKMAWNGQNDQFR